MICMKSKWANGTHTDQCSGWSCVLVSSPVLCVEEVRPNGCTETKDRQVDNFVVTAGTVSDRDDNARCHQWPQSCQIYDLLFLLCGHLYPERYYDTGSMMGRELDTEANPRCNVPRRVLWRHSLPAFLGIYGVFRETFVVMIASHDMT